MLLCWNMFCSLNIVFLIWIYWLPSILKNLHIYYYFHLQLRRAWNDTKCVDPKFEISILIFLKSSKTHILVVQMIPWIGTSFLLETLSCIHRTKSFIKSLQPEPLVSRVFCSPRTSLYGFPVVSRTDEEALTWPQQKYVG